MPLNVSVINYIECTEVNSYGQVIYHGFALPGTATSAAGWMIIKFTYDASTRVMTYKQFANGNSQFTNIWGSRDTYSYS